MPDKCIICDICECPGASLSEGVHLTSEECIEALKRRVQELESHLRDRLKEKDLLYARTQDLMSQLCEERRKRRALIGWPAERTEEG